MKRQCTFVKTVRPGEAFWSEVVEPFGRDAFVVRVDNLLGGTEVHGLQYGKEFVLRRSEITDTMVKYVDD